MGGEGMRERGESRAGSHKWSEKGCRLASQENMKRWRKTAT